jgi:predicted nucleic-acid-binding protein
MKVTADTNVLLRLILADDEAQSLAAVEAMERASLVAISVHSLCELAWVLSTRMAMPRDAIAAAIRGLIQAENVVVNRPAVEAGLAVLAAGGDFADGVIAFDGQWLGGETFMSFDKKAVKLLQRQNLSALLLK